jgi:callose synthase
VWHLISTLTFWLNFYRSVNCLSVREKDLLLVPYCKDREMDIIQWPPFLLASKVHILSQLLLVIIVNCGMVSFYFLNCILDSNSIGYGSRQWRKRSRSNEKDEVGSIFYLCYQGMLCFIQKHHICFSGWSTGKRVCSTFSFLNVIQCWFILNKLHDIYFSFIEKIFKVVDDHIAEDILIKELNMSNLPTLSKKFIELLDILV